MEFWARETFNGKCWDYIIDLIAHDTWETDKGLS